MLQSNGTYIHKQTHDDHSVAITGLSCRFPGDGDNLDNFWTFICAGKSAWSEIPKDRFNVEAFWSPKKNRNTSITRGAHFMKQDVAVFDANFFSISKTEAEAMDPQHRIMIEVVYEALEKAGLPLDKIAGTQTGVFMGHFTSDYKEMIYRDPDNAPSYAATGASKTSLANRISWLFDLRGPSFTLDTACSSSLVALHLACQSLRTGESSMAIVGGSSLLLNPEMFMYLSNQQFLSPDGKCKSFDESANGYGRGEGFACVILKRVDDAIIVGDPIRAIIRGTGSNQDGHTKGFTLPSADAQAALIEETYRFAGIDYRDTNYVEAHGTGTQAGDTQETEALARTIAATHSSENKLLIGSVKSNIGHLEAAAGIAGIIKAVLILENGLIPPTIHLNKLNPKIPFDKWNVEVPTKITPWPTDGVRRISTNSFGYGGTNAHAVLEDAYHYLKSRGIQGTHFTKIGLTNGSTEFGFEEPKTNGVNYPNGPRLLVLTAQDKQGLTRVKEQLVEYIDTKLAYLEDDTHKRDLLLEKLAYSINEKRSRLQWKTFAIASSLEELAERLKDEETPMTVTQSSRVPRIGFVFTGQGAQWPRMGVELMNYNTFEESVKAADRYLREECDCSWSAIEELEKGKLTSQLHLAVYSQTLCTVLQVALVDLLKTWNISPVAVAGHSSGEIAAAYCQGALSRKDAWKVAYYRGILSSDMKITDPDLDGSMMAVGASPEVAQKWISQVTKGDVVVACINSPSSVTVSGDTSAIDEVFEMIQQDGVFARKLHVDTAYHSPHMQVVAQDYYEALSDLMPLDGRAGCTMHSSVTGSVIEPRDLGAVSWVKNLTSTVRFSDAIYDMIRPANSKGQHSEDNMVEILIEVGPHSALQGPATQSLKAHDISNVPYLSVLKRNTDGIDSALELAGSLSTMGVQVDINAINNNGGIISSELSPKILIDLPSYPWKHSQRHWHESRLGIEYRQRDQPRLSLLGAPTAPNSEGEKVWRGSINVEEEPWIADHKIQGLILYPAAGFLAMAIEAAAQMSTTSQKLISTYRLRDVQLTSAAVITEGDTLECVIQLRPHVVGTKDSSSTWTEFVIASSSDGKSLVNNCSGLLLLEFDEDEGPDMKREKDFTDKEHQRRLLEASLRCKNPISTIDFYADLTKIGLEYGPAFTNLTTIRNAQNESAYAVKIPDIETRIIRGGNRPHIIHPATLDAIFHAAFAAVQGSNTITLSTAMVPRSIEEIVIASNIPYDPGVTLNGFSNAARHGFNDLTSDIFVFDEQETAPIVQIKGFQCAKIPSASSTNSTEKQAKPIVSSLVWKPAIDLLLPEEQKIAIGNGRKFNLDDSSNQTFNEQESSALTAMRRLVGEISKDDISPELIPFYDRLKAESNRATLHCDTLDVSQVDTIYQILKRVILGQGDTQEITRDKYLLNSLLWEGQAMKSAMTKLAEYVKLLHHTNPGLSILEIGMGPDKSSPIILGPGLDGIETVLKTGNYTISCMDEMAKMNLEEFLSAQQEGFGAKLLDVNQDISEQKLKDQAFDLVIAFNLGTHANNLDAAVHKFSKVLKKGGRVCLVEAIHPGSFLTVFGHATSSHRVHELKHLMIENGLIPEFTVHNSEEIEFRELDLTVYTTNQVEQNQTQGGEIMLIEAPERATFAQRTSDSIAMSLEQAGYKTNRFVWGSDVTAIKGKPCIALVEIENSILQDLEETDFEFLKDFVFAAQSIFWVVGFSNSPSANMIDGLARVVRNEMPGLSFRTIHAADRSLSSGRLGQLISRAFLSTSPDTEFEIKKGLLNVSRVHEEEGLNNEIHQLVCGTGNEIVKAPLGQASYPLKLCISNPGILDSLCFEPDDLPETDLEAGKIEIEVKATALNFREVMVAMGQIADSLLGFDAAGIVRRIGSAVTKFKVGDRVAMYGHGGHRTIHRSRADFCQLIPEDLTFEQAASIPVVHGTAWYGLIRLARVQKGQSILIHAAAGGVGQAAIQIAKHFEMEIFATASSAAKRKLLREEYDIPDDHIFNSRDLSFVQGVKRMTNGRGVDVVLNSLSGEALRQTWYCIAPFGIFLEIGLRDILANTELDMRPLLQDATFSFFNLNHIENSRPDIMASIIEGAFDFQRRGITRPITPLVVYPISEIESAFRLMQAGKHLGKIALTWSADAVVSFTKRGNNELSLSAEAVYLLAGGLGGLGRSLCQMLVDHGARKLCILSRSGDSSAQAKDLIANLEERDVRMAVYKCDIAEKQELDQALSKCVYELGAVHGVFQCAMVLRDTTFMNMNHKQWIESTRPKVQGSWNLSQCLPDVDFFVTLSSFAGIFGNRGQANYAAAGAYEDALANYRRAHGQHGTTIDLGIMREIGVLAETGITDSLAEWEDPYGIREKDFHALMKHAITGDMTNTVSPQLITGLATGGSAIAAGITMPFYLEDARFSILEKTGFQEQNPMTINSSASTQTLVSQAKSLTEATDIVLDALVQRVAKILHTSISEIDTNRFLHSYGIDSLVAIEVVNWALKEIKSTITVFDVLAAVPITTTASKIAAKSSLLSKELA